MQNPLQELPLSYRRGEKTGITSVCSAHPIVIEAALRLGRDTGRDVLIEATCNQVNQEGGYTGMTPAMFRSFVEGLAEKSGMPMSKVILGGDHLGPNPWKQLPASEAMVKAEDMVAAYAAAGFTKLHLDCSMGCAGEPAALADEATAERAARLAAVAERNTSGPFDPVYVIGTEVPIPGGAFDSLDHLKVTNPDAVFKTFDVHRAAFAKLGEDAAFARVIALVVQPGVEFGHDSVVHFARDQAQALSGALDGLPQVVFEAHSTDYQTVTGLKQLTQLGFSILKVGPWLTFALREALYGLDAIVDILEGQAPTGRLMQAMEQIMQAAPENWKKYYTGSETDLWLLRHFSYSDRIRYYWPSKPAMAAVASLRKRLDGKTIPPTLLHQFLPQAELNISSSFEGLLIQSVQTVLKAYSNATDG